MEIQDDKLNIEEVQQLASKLACVKLIQRNKLAIKWLLQAQPTVT